MTGRGSGPPIGDVEPSIEGTDTHRGRQRPRWRGRGRRLAARTLNLPGTLTRGPWSIRVRGSQLATPNPPSRESVPTKDVGALGGGVGVADWLPRPLPLSIFLYRTKMKQNGKLMIDMIK
ncbi:hypothetical protein CRG98_014665 [Punica granatum]|uniref:Uncharacterized protein n=1 Tax=Punica granatum TaxID=22663 RepID=A0A2I0K9Y6_PUNGR|nr:hypothetical protein CRG98_014665 [Punica granatum]